MSAPIECTRDDITEALAFTWSVFYAPPKREGNRFSIILDGHFGVGFSLRLFGPAFAAPALVAKARAARERTLRALEDLGFEVTRNGNEWQDGCLVLGWAAERGVRFADLAPTHPARVARAERLRAARKGGAS